MFDKLISDSPTSISHEYLTDVLFEMSNGRTCFGVEFADEEWKPWLLFLLPDLILRSYEDYAFTFLIEEVVSAFVIYFGNLPDSEYAGFRKDACDTLGVALMNPRFWGFGQPTEVKTAENAPVFLVDDFKSRINKLIGGRDGESAFSSAMFFCLKYLQPRDMGSWVESILSIEDSFWKASVLNWVIAVRNFSNDITFQSLDHVRPQIHWANSFLLDRSNEPLVTSENIIEFQAQIKRQLTGVRLTEWAAQLKIEKRFYEGIGEEQTASLDWLLNEVRHLIIT